MNTRVIYNIILFFTLISFISCEWEKLPAPVKPHVSAPTTNLEAMFVQTPITSLTDKHWNTADYVSVQLSNIEFQKLYSDGLLNMTGTYNGLSDFNGGDSVNLVLKAAFDNENIYILATWKDKKGDASYKTWLFDGEIDPLKTDVAEGWTSQKNSDKLYMIFEGLNSNQKDFWKWDMALSEPFGMAMDMYIEQDGTQKADAGDPFYERNTVGTTDRSGPKYVWNGETQQMTLKNGKTVLLDPTYYLLNKKDFIGDVAAGRKKLNKGSCSACHGKDLSGGSETALNFPEMNRSSDAAIELTAGNEEHQGIDSWNLIASSLTDKDNFFAALRSISGIPGYVLLTPTGSGTDIITYSNVNVSNFSAPDNKEYKLLMVRKLNTGYTDDILLDTNKTINFTIGLTDNDEINYVGKQLSLTFKFKYND